VRRNGSWPHCPVDGREDGPVCSAQEQAVHDVVTHLLEPLRALRALVADLVVPGRTCGHPTCDLGTVVAPRAGTGCPVPSRRLALAQRVVAQFGGRMPRPCGPPHHALEAIAERPLMPRCASLAAGRSRRGSSLGHKRYERVRASRAVATVSHRGHVTQPQEGPRIKSRAGPARRGSRRSVETRPQRDSAVMGLCRRAQVGGDSGRLNAS
jgi:hypothetical protein